MGLHSNIANLIKLCSKLMTINSLEKDDMQ